MNGFHYIWANGTRPTTCGALGERLQCDCGKMLDELLDVLLDKFFSGRRAVHALISPRRGLLLDAV
jgi:hypothetical protein